MKIQSIYIKETSVYLRRNYFRASLILELQDLGFLFLYLFCNNGSRGGSVKNNKLVLIKWSWKWFVGNMLYKTENLLAKSIPGLSCPRVQVGKLRIKGSLYLGGN